MLSTSPRDPFSTPCEKVIPEPYSHQPRPEIPSRLPARSNPRAIVSRSHHKYPVLVVSIRIQLRVSFTVGPAIDRSVLPCRGAPTYPPRSLNSGRTHFLGHTRPRPNDTPQPYLQLSREVPVGLTYAHGGLGHRPSPSGSLRAGRVQAPPLQDGAGPARPRCCTGSLTELSA